MGRQAKPAAEPKTPKLTLHQGEDYASIYRRVRGGGDQAIATISYPNEADVALLRRMAASEELLECAELLRHSLRYEIQRARAKGDEESARGMTLTLNITVLPALAKATGREPAVDVPVRAAPRAKRPARAKRKAA